MRRPLSEREQQVLLTMIERANPAQEMPAPTPAVRDDWRSSVPDLMVDELCGCGQCPSISLTTDRTAGSRDEQEQTVLSAFLSDALVILVLEDGVPSYLELAPLDDAIVYTEFPDASTLVF